MSTVTRRRAWPSPSVALVRLSAIAALRPAVRVASRYSGYVNMPPAFARMETRRSALAIGSGLNRTALTSEKTAVLAPMPIVSVRITVIEVSGLRTQKRNAARRSAASP